MSVILFFIVLVVLVIVHEFGHFLVAKLSGMKVEEFGFGFPPKLFSVRKGETEYSFNALPFGGFVRILGENPLEVTERCLAGTLTDQDAKRSFSAQSAFKQGMVVIAGVVFNFLLAWVLFSAGFMIGMPVAAPKDDSVTNTALLITSVVKDSPAAKAGFQLGDKIVGLSNGAVAELTEESVPNFIAAHLNEEVQISVERGGEQKNISVIPEEGVVVGRAGIGISLAYVGIEKLPFFKSIWAGLKHTALLSRETALSLFNLVRDAFLGQARLDSLTGPVGLVGIVGSAYHLGIVHLIALTALISINLAIINLVPFPALDGGRLVVIILEKLKGSALSPKIVNTINTLGFVLLIFLLILVTYHDILRLL